MANFNKIILMGNVTRDPQLSYLPSQTPVCEFGLAVNRKWVKDGQKREEVCFIDCQCFGKLAETLNQYAHKGDPLLVEGRLKFDTWQDKNGNPRSKHRVVIESFQLLGAPKPQAAPQTATPAQQPPTGDDIPF